MSGLKVQAYQLALLLLVPLLLLLHLARRRRHGHGSNSCKNKKLPPSPPGRLPIIGHLHLVGSLPHISLRDLAAKHGCYDLMLLQLGAVPNLVVSSSSTAEAILRTHDLVFASRGLSRICNDLFYGSSDIAFSPYGHHWRQIRKLITTHLLTVNKVRSCSAAVREEVCLVIARIRKAAAAGTFVDMSMASNTFANDFICRVVSGKFLREEGRNKVFRELVVTNSFLVGGFHLEEYFPGLVDSLGFLGQWFPFLLGNNRAAQAHNRRWDELLETILSEHERKTSNSEGDFIDVLLSVQQEYGITRDHVKAILMDMFGAGTYTSSLVLELEMAELMRNPQCRAKLQEEVRKHTTEGQDMVGEENLGSMPYLRAVVKETLRLHPPAPLLVPQFSMADCVIDGYFIPSATRVIVNAWAIARDPELWEKPEEFMPERFMDCGSAASIDLRGTDFQLLPFGSGRRICPGLNFGLATVDILLANLVYCFDWQLPMGMEEKDVDMTEVFGLWGDAASQGEAHACSQTAPCSW